MAEFGLTVIGGGGFIVTVVEALSLQPFRSVTVTVYVMVVDGVATGLEIFGLLNPFIGSHE